MVGVGGTAALDQLAPLALDGAAQLHHPGYFAHMDPASADVACAAALWMVATNQNMLHPDAAPAARRLERLVVEWLAPLYGMSGGHLVPGSTVANITALWAARDVAGGRSEIRTPSRPPPRQAPTAAPDLVSEGWAFGPLLRQVCAGSCAPTARTTR